jgi:hypothetical protein
VWLACCGNELFYFRQHSFKSRGLCSGDIFITNMFVVGNRFDLHVMSCIILSEYQLAVCTLIVIGIHYQAQRLV